MYRVAQNIGTFLYALELRQILIDFPTFFTARIRWKFVIVLLLKVPQHLKYVVALACKNGIMALYKFRIIIIIIIINWKTRQLLLQDILRVRRATAKRTRWTFDV